ncbi:hypothetical protein FJZ17_02940 [Candidatus Pacearchaeota archaeon]|nr:hypothetical protein [Candidatus Pacearchaeota archaeon]
MGTDLKEVFPDYRTIIEYNIPDPSFARVSQALRGIAWDLGGGKYLVSGANTRIEVSDDEKSRGLVLKVITFLKEPEVSVRNTLAALGATPRK